MSALAIAIASLATEDLLLALCQEFEREQRDYELIDAINSELSSRGRPA